MSHWKLVVNPGSYKPPIYTFDEKKPQEVSRDNRITISGTKDGWAQDVNLYRTTDYSLEFVPTYKEKGRGHEWNGFALTATILLDTIFFLLGLFVGGVFF